MPTIVLEGRCCIEVDDEGRCLDDWSIGTFVGVLKVRMDGRASALQLARTIYPTIRENRHILAATTANFNVLSGLARERNDGVLLPIQTADLRQEDGLILAHVPVTGRPAIATAACTPSGIEVMPPVPALQQALSRERWRDLLAAHRADDAVVLDTGGGTFWAALPTLVIYPWSQVSLGDALERGETAGWSAAEHLELARRLLTGLSGLHSAGLVHGDVRPCNILADGDWRRPDSYKFAEYGRFPSAAPLNPSTTYLLAGSWDSRYRPDGAGEVEVVIADCLRTAHQGDRLILTAGHADEAEAVDAEIPAGAGLADDCHLLLMPPLAFDCLAVRRNERDLTALCQAHCWRIEGRFLVPAGVVTASTRHIDGVQIARRPSIGSDLFSLAMVLLELLASEALPPHTVGTRLQAEADSLEAALLSGASGLAPEILRRVSLREREPPEWPWLALCLRLALFCLHASGGSENAGRIAAVVAQSRAEQRALGLSSV